MNKQPQQFSIECYEVCNDCITVITEKYNAEIPVTIPRDKFEFWLRLESKLDWVMDTSDHQGEHHQFNGTMSFDEYWSSDSHYIKADLYQYIVSHPIQREGVVYTNSLESLLLAFDLHNAARVHPVPYQTRWEHDQDILN